MPRSFSKKRSLHPLLNNTWCKKQGTIVTIPERRGFRLTSLVTKGRRDDNLDISFYSSVMKSSTILDNADKYCWFAELTSVKRSVCCEFQSKIPYIPKKSRAKDTEYGSVSEAVFKTEEQQKSGSTLFQAHQIAMLARTATCQGRIAAEVIAGQASVFDVRASPSVACTAPQIAWCGSAKRRRRVPLSNGQEETISWPA